MRLVVDTRRNLRVVVDVGIGHDDDSDRAGAGQRTGADELPLKPQAAAHSAKTCGTWSGQVVADDIDPLARDELELTSARGLPREHRPTGARASTTVVSARTRFVLNTLCWAALATTPR